ncbi:unnamed protein product [Arctogadus glacialis]
MSKAVGEKTHAVTQRAYIFPRQYLVVACSWLKMPGLKNVPSPALTPFKLRETCLSKNLKRKVDCENRAFNEEWKEKYVFILPVFVNPKPLCLICNEVTAPRD